MPLESGLDFPLTAAATVAALILMTLSLLDNSPRPPNVA